MKTRPRTTPSQGDRVDGAPPMSGQPDLLNVAKHHAPGVVYQYLVETVAALARAEQEIAYLEDRGARLEAALLVLYEEASSSWDDDDIREDTSYAQQGGVIRARTLHAARAALYGGKEGT